MFDPAFKTFMVLFVKNKGPMIIQHLEHPEFYILMKSTNAKPTIGTTLVCFQSTS